MPSSDAGLPGAESAAWETVEELVRAFESALARGESPHIDDYLPAPGVDRPVLLAELVQAELEYRLESGEAARVESYVQRFPELQQSADTFVALIVAEFRFRQGCDSALSWQEYSERFPQYKIQIESRLHDAVETASTTGGDHTPLTDETPPSGRSGAAPANADRYEPIRFHIRGGLGEIHLAHDNELHRQVALKRIQPRHAHHAEVRRRFLLEAEVTAGLQHPGVVPVYSLTEDKSGEPFYAMRFIEGESLQDAIERFHRAEWRGKGRGQRTLELRQLLGRFVAVCNTIAFAHSRGILHRDLKPGNIMLGKYGETLVVDWGLARDFEQTGTESADDEETLEPSSAGEAPTRMGRALGTLPFMSPEQAAGRWDVIGPASDIYSLGATLYTIVCGKPPIHDGDEAEMIEQAIRGDHRRPRQHRPDVPRPLEAVCLKAMAPPIEARYSSALDLAQDVEHWLADEPVTARRDDTLERLGRWARRHGNLVAVTVLCLILFSLSFAWVSHYRTAAEQLPLLRRFHEELDAGDWTAAHLDQMESLLANLAELSLSQAAEERGRLAQRLGDNIRKTLGRRALKDDDVRDLNAALRLLEMRDPENAQQLGRAFALRKGQLQPVLDLQPPYTAGKLQAVLGPCGADFQPAPDRSYLLPSAASDPPRRLISTGIACRGRVMINVSFHETALDSSQEIGVALNYDASRKNTLSPAATGYLFLLSSLPSPASARTPSRPGVSLGQAIRTGLALRMRIERSGTVLRQDDIHVPTGPLVLHAERAADRLLFQVSALPPLESQDIFPLMDAEPGCFALVGSAGLGVAAIQASRQIQAPEPNEIERGDFCYAERQFAMALEHYLQEARQSAGTEAGQEALCKQAFCCAAMNRTSEAMKMFEELGAQDEGRWSLVAACQLWLHWIRQNRFDEATALLERIATHYSFDQLARYVQEDARTAILDAYQPRMDPYDFYRHDRARLQRLEQLATVEELFNAPNERKCRTKLFLVFAYQVMGQLDKAALIGHELVHDPSLPPELLHATLERLTSVLLESNPADVLGLVEKFLVEGPGKYRPQFLFLLPKRASAHAALERWDLAAQDLQDYFRLAVFDKKSPKDYLSACLLKGFLLERGGERQGAKAAWREGYLKVKGTTHMSYLTASILGSLTKELTEEDTARIIESFAAMMPIKVPIYSLGKSGLFPLRDLTLALRSMWNTTRGRDYARSFAFERMPLRDCLRVQFSLFVLSMMQVSAFRDSMSAEEEAMIWELIQASYDAWAAGKIKEDNYFRVVIAWLGATNQFGWQGASSQFPRELRGPLEYCMAHRYLVLGMPAKSREFFQAALQDADTNGTLERLVRARLGQFESR